MEAFHGRSEIAPQTIERSQHRIPLVFSILTNAGRENSLSNYYVLSVSIKLAIFRLSIFRLLKDAISVFTKHWFKLIVI